MWTTDCLPTGYKSKLKVSSNIPTLLRQGDVLEPDKIEKIRIWVTAADWETLEDVIKKQDDCEQCIRKVNRYILRRHGIELFSSSPGRFRYKVLSKTRRAYQLLK